MPALEGLDRFGLWEVSAQLQLTLGRARAVIYVFHGPSGAQRFLKHLQECEAVPPALPRHPETSSGNTNLLQKLLKAAQIHPYIIDHICIIAQKTRLPQSQRLRALLGDTETQGDESAMEKG